MSYDAGTRTASLVPSADLAIAATYTAELTAAIKATDGGALTPASWSFTTGSCPCSLFSDVLTPSATGNPTADGRTGAGPWTYEMGVKFSVSAPVSVTAIRFYKDPNETGTHVGRIWTATGTALANVTFAGETASGWQVQNLASPLTLQPGVVYVASVGLNAFFDVTGGGLASQITSGPLSSVADGANGVFATSAGTFPTLNYGSSNYFVDVVVQ